ncbi:glutaredoxin domain-containing protein [Rhodococcus ruber]|uniref:glutaredoxin domain-containing protein n=1 Tax=Rhodococcus ruber TaxID=1830 RepID=UPI00296E548F|nr:glutaredoxin domain-containing protein [Rhodococcus ruber]
MTAVPAQVVVYWRPGCPYCRRLRRDLDRIGLVTREVNIWEDPDAAAAVRSIAAGDETVPTVIVGPVAMVNPGVADVVDAASTFAPAALAGLDEHTLTVARRKRLSSGMLLSLTFAGVWLVVATVNPATTYHLAPLLVVAAWPLALRWRTRAPLTAATSIRAAAAGMAVAAASTVVLVARHGLAGPTLTGSAGALAETVAAIAVGAALGAAGALIPRPGRQL